MRSSALSVIILIFVVLGVSACASYRPPHPAFHKVLSEPYTLDAGDELRVTVFNQDDLTNSYMVDKSGYIAFPLVGSVRARGKTTKQMEQQLAAKLRKDYLRNPDVSVEVATYRPFFIMGEVESGGQYTYVPGTTVQNAVAIAGGFTARAEQTDVDVTRHVNGEVITGRVPLSDPILPGDTIFIRERLF